jgi:hypothetical protein
VREPYRGLDDIRSITALPKLIIQSADDANVPRVRGESLFAAATEPKQFWSTEGPHIATLIRYPKETANRLRAMVKLSVQP